MQPVSPRFCAENNISISYLTENGRFLGRFQGNVSGNVLLRRNQYRWADDPEKTGYVARTIIQGKIINSIAVLNRFLRDSKEVNESVKSAVNELKHILGAVEKSNDLEVIRGIEGIAAKCYFNVFNNLIKQQKMTLYLMDEINVLQETRLMHYCHLYMLL